MPELFGHTRAHVGPRHALLTPHNHVPSQVPGITGAATIILINEAIGAKFSQLLVTFEKGGRATFRQAELQTFGYVISGEVTLMLAGDKQRLTAGGYFYSPAGMVAELLTPKAGTQVTLFHKRYVPTVSASAPHSVTGHSDKVKGTPFLGDPAANLKTLLPDAPAFDMAVNLFSYVPGGHLPFVEVHVMEHGLIMLDGQGVYRLEDAWYPVEKGDVIWMGPYCPQWFVAMGKTPATYLYYKDVNRAAL